MERLYEALIRPLDPAQLKEWILAGDVPLVVVDVRTSDYRVARIKGSVNIPSNHFNDETIQSELLGKWPLSGGYTYVFHCMRSQIRGPACAKRFVRHLLLKTEAKDDPGKMPRVYLLTGGLKAWNRLYGADPALMEAI